ncbi:MAG TPA: sugar transferase [Desulfobacterales bacterium]|nr:sugar transferase [Desulfobacterales bacterium]
MSTCEDCRLGSLVPKSSLGRIKDLEAIVGEHFFQEVIITDELIEKAELVGLLDFFTSRGPVFYRPRAIGKGGRLFTMFKFRSMFTGASKRLHQDYVTKQIKGEIRQDPSGQPLKITNDARVTRVGGFLRKTSLDEMPQLINVLKGDMNLTVPRPCLPYEWEIYKDWHKKRSAVRPGITGLRQVLGRSEVSFEDMIILDLYYIYNRSFDLDLSMLFETIFVVLKKKGGALSGC